MIKHLIHTIIPLTLIVCVLIGAPTTTHAERATILEAEMVSQNWMSYIVSKKGTWADDPTPEILQMEEIIENDTLVGYLYHVKPSGYIVVPLLKEIHGNGAINKVSREFACELLVEALLHAFGKSHIYLRSVFVPRT